MTRNSAVLLALTLATLAGCAKKEETCSSDLTLCDAGCTSLAMDAANCGACGHACPAGESCAEGSCLCPSATVCGGLCLDLESDPNHCGSCDVACAANEVCTTSGGVTSCASSCAAGQTSCKRACVDLDTNVRSCGACGRACGTNERCAAGRCISDLYVACYNSDEVREATFALAAAGLPRAVAPGPMGLAWSGDLLAVASSKRGFVENVSTFRFGPPRVRQKTIWEPSSTGPDLEYLAEHDELLYVSHASLGTLLILAPGGAVVDEVRFAAPGALNPDPLGIAFDGNERAYLALSATGEVVVLDVSQALACALGAHSRPCTKVLARVDLSALASANAEPMPARIAVSGGRAFVSLSNLDALFQAPAGSTGRLAAIRTDTLDLDADFAGTTTGVIDLGPDCLDASDVAVQGDRLYVSCGFFDYSSWPPVIQGSGVVPVDLSGPVAQVLPKIEATDQQAPGKLAFCGSTGYVGDRNSGTVWAFDPAGATSLGAGVALCPLPSSGWTLVSDIACGR